MALERLLELLDPAPVLSERNPELVGVVEEDVDPDPRVRAGDAGHVPQRAARGREWLVPVDARRARLIHDQVRERVGQVARQRDEPVVRSRIDGDRRRAELADEAVHEPVTLRIGLGERGQEPGCAFEELGVTRIRRQVRDTDFLIREFPRARPVAVVEAR